MTRVLIAVDDSDTSVAAAQAAHRLFGDFADYTVVNVATGRPVLWGDDELHAGTAYPLALPGGGVIGAVPLVVSSGSLAGPPRNRIDVAEQTAHDIARQAGVDDAQPVGEAGDPAAAILAVAEEYRADVIVVGTPDRGWFKSLFRSSVADAVVRHAEVPVLVAR